MAVVLSAQRKAALRWAGRNEIIRGKKAQNCSHSGQQKSLDIRKVRKSYVGVTIQITYGQQNSIDPYMPLEVALNQ